MKQLLISFAIFGSWAPWHYAHAQTKSEQTIVIDGTKNQTTVEIKDGDVFVDGKKVAPYNLKNNIKIIRKFGNAEEFDIHVDGDTPQEDMNFSFRRPGDRGVIHSNQALLGVQTEPVANNLGAQVQVISEGSPADLSGIQVGDVIVKVDNQTITNPQDLATAIASYKPADKVDITVLRNREESTIAVVLAENHNDQLANSGLDMRGFDDMFRNFGMGQDLQNGFNFPGGFARIFGNMQPGTPATQDAPKIGAEVEERADGDGLLVIDVKQGSSAEKAGMRSGDVITTVGGKKMSNVDELSSALYELKSKRDIVVNVKRGTKTETLYIEVPVELRKREF
jgi:serine protease Do